MRKRGEEVTNLPTSETQIINYNIAILLGFILLIIAMLGLLIWKKRRNN